jgi:hypothetical protein
MFLKTRTVTIISFHSALEIRGIWSSWTSKLDKALQWTLSCAETQRQKLQSIDVNTRVEGPVLSGVEGDSRQEPQSPFSVFDVEAFQNVTSATCSLRTFEIPSHRLALLLCGTRARRITAQLRAWGRNVWSRALLSGDTKSYV